MIGIVMPPKSPDDEAIVDEIESTVVIAVWASSSIMSGEAARTGAFSEAAQERGAGKGAQRRAVTGVLCLARRVRLQAAVA